jgi:hypothetical protein
VPGCGPACGDFGGGVVGTEAGKNGDRKQWVTIRMWNVERLDGIEALFGREEAFILLK